MSKRTIRFTIDFQVIEHSPDCVEVIDPDGVEWSFDNMEHAVTKLAEWMYGDLGTVNYTMSMIEPL